MSKKIKLKPQEVEEQLLKLRELIETEPAPPPVEGAMKPIKSDTEICVLIADMMINAHRQKNYGYLGKNDDTISRFEEDPSWAHPDLKRKVGHLRAMHTLLSKNTSSGCMIAFIIGLGISFGSYWILSMV